MKQTNIFFSVLALTLISVASHSQNTFPATGNVGIGTASPSALLQVANGASRFGNSRNYTNIDSLGNLSFTGTARYKVGGNKYVFQYSNNTHYGLFFNAASFQYEFRNGSAVPVFSVDANTGNGIFNGTVKVGAYTLPATDGTSGQVLTANGAGGVNWSTVSSGGGSQWKTSGSNIYYNTGNVGIGNPSPATKLSVAGTGNSYVFSASNGTVDIRTYNAATFGQVGTYTNHPFQLMANNGINQFVLLPNGNVGIGNANPVAKISVKIPSSGNAFQATNGTVDIRTYQNNAYGQIGTYTNNAFQLMANGGTDQFVLLPNGNVGIGTGAPSLGGLVVDKKAGAVNALFGSTTTGVAIESSFPGIGLNTYYNSGRKYIAAGYGGLISLDPATGLLSVYNTPAAGTANAAAGIAANLSITATGNVGIGTNIPAGKLDVAGDAYINGVRVGKGNYVGSGYGNTATGASALQYNTSGSGNTAIGSGTLSKNKTGTSNTALGYIALANNTTGESNTASGSQALYRNKSASYNTASGNNALFNDTSGNFNNAVGYNTLYNNTQGFNNNAFGAKSLYENTSGNYNTAIGDAAMYSNQTGSLNTATGKNALYTNESGNENSATGRNALYSNKTGNGNVANGVNALFNNAIGYSNVAIGKDALYKAPNSRNQVAIGDSALYNDTSDYLLYFPSYNVAVGSKTLYTNTSGFNNTAIGSKSLYENTTGSNNVAIGFVSLNNNDIGISNTAIGTGALYSNTLGSGNTALGFDASRNNKTGSHNTALGLGALALNTTGSYNTAIGYAAAYFSTLSFTNITAIGSDSYSNASNKVVVGSTEVTVIGGQVGWSTLSDGRFKKDIKQNVPGLEFINKLKPVTYYVQLEKFEKFLGRTDSALQRMRDGFKANEQKLRTGFVAQEVEKAAREINYDFDGINKPQNEKDNYSLVYADFVPSLVKAVQELSKKNEEKDAKVEEQQAINKNLQQQIDALKSLMASNPSSSNQQQSVTISSAALEQNIPNPFTDGITINYTLPEKYASAVLVFTDKKGSIIKKVNLSGSGKGSVRLKAFSLSSGAYQYSLYVNGEMIGTRQMVSAK